jgi:HPt (histidine-containing phosphotransfer) domain-containing protein
MIIALDRLWSRFLPTLLERVSTLESAAAAFADHKLTGEQQEAAFAAAHNLAGVLGTFSLERGSALARELELLFGLARGPNRHMAARLSSLAAELRALIENR